MHSLLVSILVCLGYWICCSSKRECICNLASTSKLVQRTIHLQDVLDYAYSYNTQSVQEHIYESLSRYQVPASRQESLYAQLGSYHIRTISRENIAYVLWFLLVCVYVSLCVCFSMLTYIRVFSKLGTGQFGKVCKAVWTEGGEETEVAVKTLTDSANTVKFLQEAAIISQFRHPNILTLHGVVSAGHPVSITIHTFTPNFLIFRRK